MLRMTKRPIHKHISEVAVKTEVDESFMKVKINDKLIVQA